MKKSIFNLIYMVTLGCFCYQCDTSVVTPQNNADPSALIGRWYGKQYLTFNYNLGGQIFTIIDSPPNYATKYTRRSIAYNPLNKNQLFINDTIINVLENFYTYSTDTCNIVNNDLVFTTRIRNFKPIPYFDDNGNFIDTSTDYIKLTLDNIKLNTQQLTMTDVSNISSGFIKFNNNIGPFTGNIKLILVKQ